MWALLADAVGRAVLLCPVTVLPIYEPDRDCAGSPGRLCGYAAIVELADGCSGLRAWVIESIGGCRAGPARHLRELGARFRAWRS